MGFQEVAFPKGTKILVTGGAGFIGSNICDALIEKGVDVVCLDNFSTGKKENIKHLLDGDHFKLIEGDITVLETCLVASKGVDYIIHQAAWGSVPRSIEMPLFYEKNNVLGTMNIFEAARINKVKKVVYASSSSVYGDSEILPKKEGVEGKVLSPYALTKRIDEEYSRLFYKLYGVKSIGLRYFNVFGRRQDPNGQYAAVIPTFVSACLRNEISYINGDGSYSRDFTYIDNVIEANLKALLNSDERSYGRAFNIAFGGQVTIEQLYSCIADLLHCDLKPIHRNNRPGDIPHSNADISDARDCFGYDPSYSFERGIKLAIDWYKTNL